MLLFSLRARCSGLPPNGCAPIVRQQRFLIAIVNPVSHGLLIKHSPPGAFMMLILCFLMYFFVFVFIHFLFQFIHSAVAVHVQFFVLFFFFFVSLPRRRQHIFHFLLLLLPSHFCRFCFLLYIYFFHILYIPSQMFMNEKKIDFLFVWKAEQEKYTFLMKIFFFSVSLQVMIELQQFSPLSVILVWTWYTLLEAKATSTQHITTRWTNQLFSLSTRYEPFKYCMRISFAFSFQCLKFIRKRCEYTNMVNMCREGVCRQSSL